jgi:ribosomal protein S12 methylthiotransferase accessory factor
VDSALETTKSATLGSLAQLERLASPFTGIVRSVDALTYAPDDPRLFRYVCEVAASSPIIGVEPSQIFTSGQHTTNEAAKMAALAEAAERYSGFYIPPERVRHTSAEEADFPVAQPESFALFSSAQYAQHQLPFEPFLSDVATGWIDGFRVATDEEVFLPVQRTFMTALEASDPDDSLITYTTSNGMACGKTLEEALLAGLLEVIERDAFMIAWSNKLVLPPVDWRSDQELSAFAEQYFTVTGLAFDGIDLSEIAGVPAVAASVRGAPGEFGAIGFGTAAALDIREAWKKAVSEAFFTRITARDLHYVSPDKAFRDDYMDINDFSDRMLFYARSENLPLVEFLFASDEQARTPPRRRRLGSVREEVARLTEVGESQGGDVFAVEITAPDVAELGFSVVKVIVPQYCDLPNSHAGQFLGGRRLYERAFEVGLRETPLDPEERNLDPHPMG